MKKIICGILFVCFLLILPVNSMSKFKNISIKTEDSSNSHTVIVEFVTISTSSESSAVSNLLYDIFSLEIYDFYYITLVSDENEVTENRLEELGISEFPAVIYDGGYIQIGGEQTNTEIYKDAIIESLSREVSPIELYLDAYWTSSPCYPQINSNIEIYNNGNSEYKGRLIISIVEVDSRWVDKNGRPYNYALLDYALDEDFSVDPAPFGSYFVTNTWFPNIDACGVPADPNILVIASIFSKNGYADATVVSRLVEGDQPTKPTTPKGPVHYKIGQEYFYSTRSLDPDGTKVRYGWDWNGDYFIDEWTDYYDSNEQVKISHIWDEKGKYNIRVKAEDESRLESYWSDPLPVSSPRNKFYSFVQLKSFLFYSLIDIIEKFWR